MTIIKRALDPFTRGDGAHGDRETAAAALLALSRQFALEKEDALAGAMAGDDPKALGEAFDDIEDESLAAARMAEAIRRGIGEGEENAVRKAARSAARGVREAVAKAAFEHLKKAGSFLALSFLTLYRTEEAGGGLELSKIVELGHQWDNFERWARIMKAAGTARLTGGDRKAAARLIEAGEQIREGFSLSAQGLVIANTRAFRLLAGNLLDKEQA